ncbi:hypothetical protein LCGC14_0643330, partial [marine sediment metagenome]
MVISTRCLLEKSSIHFFRLVGSVLAVPSFPVEAFSKHPFQQLQIRRKRPLSIWFLLGHG